MPVITLTTDFGEKDGFTGVLKGVIWGICPDAQIADITHSISPQNVLEGALALWRAAPFFPAGTVHIAVVDPGVGTNRRPMAARLGDYFYVGPDNGLFTPMIEDARNNNQVVEFVHLDKPKFWLKNVSHTFHGRDIFAPVGAHLANGIFNHQVGDTHFQTLFCFRMPKTCAYINWMGFSCDDHRYFWECHHRLEVRSTGRSKKSLFQSRWEKYIRCGGILWMAKIRRIGCTGG